MYFFIQEHLFLGNLEEASAKAKEAMVISHSLSTSLLILSNYLYKKKLMIFYKQEAATAHTKGVDNVYQAYAECVLGKY